MKALRWILFCLLTFGLGTGIALVAHPPTVGIPTATASGLVRDLTAIKSAAAAGKCDTVQSRLKTAQRRIDRLPNTTNANTFDQLNAALSKIQTVSVAACQTASDAAAAAKAKADAEAQATTPTTPDASGETDTPTPQPTPTPYATATPTTPDSGNSGGVAVPTPDTSGQGDGNDQGDGNTGGVTLPNGQTIPGPHALRRKLEEMRQELRDAWGF